MLEEPADRQRLRPVNLLGLAPGADDEDPGALKYIRIEQRLTLAQARLSHAQVGLLQPVEQHPADLTPVVLLIRGQIQHGSVRHQPADRAHLRKLIIELPPLHRLVRLYPGRPQRRAEQERPHGRPRPRLVDLVEEHGVVEHDRSPELPPVDRDGNVAVAAADERTGAWSGDGAARSHRARVLQALGQWVIHPARGARSAIKLRHRQIERPEQRAGAVDVLAATADDVYEAASGAQV